MALMIFADRLMTLAMLASECYEIETSKTWCSDDQDLRSFMPDYFCKTGCNTPVQSLSFV